MLVSMELVERLQKEWPEQNIKFDGNTLTINHITVDLSSFNSSALEIFHNLTEASKVDLFQKVKKLVAPLCVAVMTKKIKKEEFIVAEVPIEKPTERTPRKNKVEKVTVIEKISIETDAKIEQEK